MSILFQTSPEEDGALDQNDKTQDILVFGYHCKLFRDDEKALSIDAGAHLIPWMGDGNLKIDSLIKYVHPVINWIVKCDVYYGCMGCGASAKELELNGYDGRGHLYDLTSYDADKLTSINYTDMTPEEKHIEALCEEERYLELHTDLAEKAIQEEEELKRLNQELAEAGHLNFNAVGFTYDQQEELPSPATTNDNNNASDDEDDAVFIPPAELALPPSMAHPQSVKDNAVIEKTALFVSQHGGQMEIMIKTKQAGNPQFAFLTFEHPLNPYYKHQVRMIKSGRYKPEVHNRPDAKKEESADSDDDADDSGYLHPSLLRAKAGERSSRSAIVTPQLTASQLENTAYGKLIKNISANVASNSPQRAQTNDISPCDSPSRQYNMDSGAQTNSIYSSYGQNTINYTQSTATKTADNQTLQLYSQDGRRPVSPPADIKPLIERMVTYVLKDGIDFEHQVRDRHDLRFSFLKRGDKHHDYYIWRKSEALSSNPRGVSFSIKSKEGDGSSVESNRAALPVDPESDDEGQQQKVTPQVLQASQLSQAIPQVAYIVQPPILNRPAAAPSAEAIERRNAAADDIQRKLAEQKLKDKLAAAARERMTQVTKDSREKSLQAERKKKAAMFVNMLKSKSASTAVHPAPIGPELPPERLYSDSHSTDERTVSRARESLREHNSHYRTSYTQSSRHSRNQSPSRRHRSSPERSRRRRSPSPVLSLIKRKKSHHLSEEASASSHDKKKPQSEERLGINKTYESATPPPIALNTNKKQPDEELLLKVRKMLKASRRTVIEEDLFGD